MAKTRQQKVKVKFNLESLRRVTVPEGMTTIRISDPETSGFFLKVGKQKSCFYLQKRIRGLPGNPKTFFVGNLAFIKDIADVRREARRMAALCDQGKDPIEESKTARGLTLKKAWGHFKATRGKALRDSSMKIYDSQYRTHLQAIENLDLACITPEILVRLFLTADSQATAQKALILFNNIWAVNAALHLKNGKPLLGHSPYDAMKEILGDAWDYDKRDVSIIQLKDLGKYIATLEHWADHGIWEGKRPQFRAYLLCLFTGLRFHEAATLQWSAVDFEQGTITILREYAKKKREHIAYMSEYTRALLQKIRLQSLSEYVFPMLDGTGHITKRTTLFHEVGDMLGYYFTSHANRRSFFCFAMVECKIPFPTVQKMMSHKTKGNSVAEKHYFLLEKFKPGGLAKEFDFLGAELVKLRDAWLKEHGHTLEANETGNVVTLPSAEEAA